MKFNETYKKNLKKLQEQFYNGGVRHSIYDNVVEVIVDIYHSDQMTPLDDSLESLTELSKRLASVAKKILNQEHLPQPISTGVYTERTRTGVDLVFKAEYEEDLDQETYTEIRDSLDAKISTIRKDI